MGVAEKAPCQKKKPMTRAGSVQRRMTLQDSFMIGVAPKVLNTDVP
jgi:hypothetical protein